MVALSLMGSAILLFSCGSATSNTEVVNNEALMTERSENLMILMSENGRRSYHFKTPLLEGYTLASDPYREFRKGVHITTYQNDSLTTVNATLVANYAIYYEKRELWEAKGDVVVEKADGTKLYTQQLFWNSKTGRIYSNVDSKIIKGTDVFMGEGFESDEELKDWRFRRMSGKMFVNMEPTENPDSTATVSPEIPTAEDNSSEATESAPKREPVVDNKREKSREEAESQRVREERPLVKKSNERKSNRSSEAMQPRRLDSRETKRIEGGGEYLRMQKADEILRVDE